MDYYYQPTKGNEMTREAADRPATERLELMTVHTVWANSAGREFTRTKTYRAAWVADAIDMATDDLPVSCTDVIDQYMVPLR
jgi:hypothetical protein